MFGQNHYAVPSKLVNPFPPDMLLGPESSGPSPPPLSGYGRHDRKWLCQVCSACSEETLSGRRSSESRDKFQTAGRQRNQRKHIAGCFSGREGNIVEVAERLVGLI